MTQHLDFIHRFESGDETKPVLVLLHGTGGNEEDLLPLGRSLLPGAALLSPRGKVLERGMPRFFRRVAEGVFDLEDLAFRTTELARFLERAAEHYGFDRNNRVAVGFSNGANIAASLMLTDPAVMAGAILLRPMVPYEPDGPVALAGKPVLIASGDADPIVPESESLRLVRLLTSHGARVTHRRFPAGHGLTGADVEAAREWLARKT